MGSIEMKILIKGAGDLATGIASRLYGAGHQIMMTDIAVPLTVRRLVAFSRAVYEGEAVVEDMTARLAKNQEEADEIMEQGDIPVIVDPKYTVVSAGCNRGCHPCKEKSRNKDHRCTICDRSRTWIYCRRRL